MSKLPAAKDLRAQMQAEREAIAAKVLDIGTIAEALRHAAKHGRYRVVQRQPVQLKGTAAERRLLEALAAAGGYVVGWIDIEPKSGEVHAEAYSELVIGWSAAAEYDLRAVSAVLAERKDLG